MEDKEGKIQLTQYLTQRGWEVIDTDTFDKHCKHDLEATKGSKTVYIEIKKRTCTSTEWGDVIIQKDKLEHLQQFENSCVVNIFTDGLVYVADVHSTPYEEQKRYCQKTAWWDNHKVSKTLISFKIEDCKLLK